MACKEDAAFTQIWKKNSCKEGTYRLPIIPCTTSILEAPSTNSCGLAQISLTQPTHSKRIPNDVVF